jgi:hypothetical protein
MQDKLSHTYLFLPSLLSLSRYDGYNGCIVCGSDRFSIRDTHPHLPRWRVGDVVGALVDLTRRSFTFYHNGRSIEFTDSARYHHHQHQRNYPRNATDPPGGDDEPLCPLYYGAASLSTYQQLYLNHGEVPFKYPPPDGLPYQDLCLNKTVYVPTMCCIQ